MTFSNPITGGQGALVRPAIKSPNYVPNVSGWSINKDGSAEFNDVVIRGGTVVSGTALYYNGTPAFGNLILSIAATAGTDSFGNAYQAGLTSYGSLGTININGNAATWTHISGSEIDLTVGGAAASMELTPAAVVGVTWNSGSFGSNTDGTFGANTPYTAVVSPRALPNTAQAQITLHGASPSTNDSDIVISSNLNRIFGDILVRDQITTYDNNAFTSYTPTLVGTGLPPYTATGYWQRVGKMIFFVAQFTTTNVGSTAGITSFTAPTNVDKSTRQTVSGNADGMTGNSGSITALSLPGGTANQFDRIRTPTGANWTGATFTPAAGGVLVFEGWYREA